MEHIERMRKELQELEAKTEKATEFLEEEIKIHNFTDEIQRIKLASQIEHMLSYASVLKERIAYDTEKINKNKS